MTTASSEDQPDYRVPLDRGGRGPAGHPERDDIRLLAEDFWAEPEERWAWMRANAPVYWDDDEGIWGLASHEHVSTAAGLRAIKRGLGRIEQDARATVTP